MNEKVAHALQKGKEIAVPLCLKGKELALAGYAKGNELMDKVSLLQKPLHKKIVWGILGVALVWLMLPSGSVGSNRGVAFKESDFKKESSTEKMFYVKNGKDDGLKEVVPNLIEMPKSLSLETLCGSFNPELEATRHKRGMAYLNDENNTFYHCVVIHVGDGFVIAEPNDKGMFGDFCGYIETDDEYVEGQQLKTGFYEFVGRKKVPLVNGSSRSMHAFVRLDTKSNQLAVDAAIYNSKAIEATEQENGRRSVLKREQEEKMRAEAIGKAFAKESKRFKVLDVKDQIHLPPELKGKENCFKISESKVYWGGQRWMSFENIAALINEGDWKKLDNHSGLMTEDCSPEDYAKRLVDHILQGCRYAEVKDRELGVNHFDYIFVSVFPGYHEAERANIQNGLYGGANGAVVPICLGGELYLIPTSDNELVEMLGDAKKFTDAFTKKYGK